MGTETFTAFKSDGTAYKLKGRILRHLDNDPVTDADKQNIRDTLGITGVNGDLLAANNLDDVASKDTAKLNLEVPNVGTAADEVSVNGMLGDLAFQSSAGVVVDDLTVDGHFTGAVGKPMPVNGPSMRFDGVDDHVSFADNAAFSFTNTTDDTPVSFSAFVKRGDATHFTIASKYNTPNVKYIFRIDNNNKLNLWLYTDTSNVIGVKSDVGLSQAEWLHVAATYTGSGPNSTNSFAQAADGIKLYVNGKSVATSSELYGTYGGMNNTSQPLWVGRFQNTYTKGEIRDVKIFNKELSAAEVKEVYNNGQLPESFAESTGTIAYASDFSAGVDGFVAYGGAGVGNIDGIGGKNDNLRFTVDSASANHQFQKNYGSLIEDGKSVRVSAEIYIPSTNAQITGVQVNRDGSANVNVIDTVTATNAWTAVSGVFTKDYADIRFRALDGTAAVFTGNGTDVFYVRNVRIVQIGSVLDARAEQFDTSTGKLYDLSGNDFVGTQSGGVSLLGREFIIQEKGIFTPTIYYQNPTGLTISYTTQSGNYVRTGDLVAIQIKLTWTVTGTPVNDNLGVRGIPFQPAREDSLACHDSQGQTALVISNSVNDILICLSSSLTSNQADNVGTGTHTLYISGTYQIQ